MTLKALTLATLASLAAFSLFACGSEDVTHEGEPCTEIDASASCMIADEAGLEFCSGEFDTLWSACLTESCPEAGSGRSCEGGQQFCVRHMVEGKEDLRWGICTGEIDCTPGEVGDCGLPPEFGPQPRTCSIDGSGVPYWPACGTPLVLSFGAEIAFSPAPERAADFDIHGGAGVCVRADWPAAATPWLALDRDRSGRIEGGQELFGSGTRLAAGTAAANGFLALAELDTNGDGRISGHDERFAELVLWADHDGDRRSSGWELLPLASFEIVAIELRYTSRRTCDRAGNCGIERASFIYREAGLERVGEVVDVHLACE